MGLCQVRKSIRKGGKHRNGHPEAMRDAPRPASLRKARREEPERANSENEPGEDSDVALFCEQLATAIPPGGSDWFPERLVVLQGERFNVRKLAEDDLANISGEPVLQAEQMDGPQKLTCLCLDWVPVQVNI